MYYIINEYKTIMTRDPNRFFSNDTCEKYKRDNGLLTMDRCREGEIVKHPFGSRQYQIDNRSMQLHEGKIIELYMNFIATGKMFKIKEISNGGWPKWNNRKFNNYILTLERVS